MFEVMSKNRSTEPDEGEIEVSYATVSKIFHNAAKPGGIKSTKRAAWQAAVAQLITKGMCRRAHFTTVVGAEVLRNVGFDARELLELHFSAKELKAGCFEARELKVAGFQPADLKKLGYTPKELLEAEILAAVMRQLGYTAQQLRDAGYTAQQLKDSQSYTLVELKEGRYKPAELGNAGYLIPALKEAKFTALDLRKALIFNVRIAEPHRAATLHTVAPYASLPLYRFLRCCLSRSLRCLHLFVLPTLLHKRLSACSRP